MHISGPWLQKPPKFHEKTPQEKETKRTKMGTGEIQKWVIFGGYGGVQTREKVGGQKGAKCNMGFGCITKKYHQGERKRTKMVTGEEKQRHFWAVRRPVVWRKVQGSENQQQPQQP